MTAICGGGTSGPKSGSSAVVLVGSGVIATLLEKSGNPWLEFAAALLTLPELVLSSFCGSDPPAIPTFTSNETKALLNVTFGSDLNSGLAKFADLVLNLAWQDNCVCTSGALIVPPPATIPAGTPIYQAPRPQIALPCASGDQSSFLGNTGTSNWLFYFPPAGFQPTSVVFTVTSVVTFAPGPHIRPVIEWNDGVSTFDSLGPSAYPPGTTWTVTLPVPVSSARELYPQLRGESTAGTVSFTAHADIYCNGNLPGLVQQSCCPPDAATQSSLDLILRMVTLTQRQLAPFATVHGTVHTGVTGNGSIAVQGLIGVAVTLTTIPGRLGDVSGNPDTLFEAGWLNIGTADGWGPRVFISSSPFIIRPVSPDATLIGYSIPLDVTATITELVRES